MESISLVPNVMCGPHQPVAAGVQLYPETGDRQCSLHNLRRLIHVGERQVRCVLRIEDGLLVLFDTGEVYYALGFYGSPEHAEFLREQKQMSLGMDWVVEKGDL